MKGLQEKKGITLIALIVTIIILLILAGMSISMISGEGLFSKARTSADVYKKSASKEAIELLMAEYKMENASTGVTLEQFLQDEGYTEGVDYNKDGDNITFYEGEYAILLNKATGEVEEPVKTDKIVKLKANKKIVELNETLTVTVEYGSGVDITNSKYKIVKTGTEVGEIETALSGNTINIPTTNIGRYTVYLQVVYKDNSESTIKHIDIQVGTPVTSIELNKNATTIEKGSTETLTATVLPNNASEKGIIWTTSNTSIATVSNGTITAVSPGTVTVIATSADNNSITASCVITIPEHLITSITLDKSNVSMVKGNSTNIVATIEPANATNVELDWIIEPSNSNYLTLGEETITTNSNNIQIQKSLTGSNAGNVTIKAKARDGSNVESATANVTVETPTPVNLRK